MRPIKIYINRKKEGEIVCPSCRKTKSINVSNHRITNKAIEIRCNCGRCFYIILDYRKYYRKQSNICGKVFDPVSKSLICEVIITSISVGGVGFKVRSTHSFHNNDLLEIVFDLDDDSNATIREEIIIRRVDGNFVGAEFYAQDKYNSDLDFYIATQFALP